MSFGPTIKPLVTVRSPGEILFYEWMQPMQITQLKLSKETGIEISTIHGILRNKRNITPRIAWAFSKFFNTDKFYWIGLQNKYDFWEIERGK